MENSILNTLPAELRVKVYAEVFDGAKITINVGQHPVRGDKPPIEYIFSSGCNLAVTCRAIKVESAEIMWRSAIVKAVGRSGESIYIHELNKALPDEIAQNITYLTNVRFRDLCHAQEWDHESVATSLLKYPSLQTCVASDLDYYMSEDMKIDGCFSDEYLNGLYAGNKNQQLVPFEYDMPFGKPDQYLKTTYGIKDDCSIQFIGRERIFSLHYYDYPPLEVIPPLEADGYMNYSSGICWVELDPDYWNGANAPEGDAEGFRRVIAKPYRS